MPWYFTEARSMECSVVNSDGKLRPFFLKLGCALTWLWCCINMETSINNFSRKYCLPCSHRSKVKLSKPGIKIEDLKTYLAKLKCHIHISFTPGTPVGKRNYSCTHGSPPPTSLQSRYPHTLYKTSQNFRAKTIQLI